MSTKDTTRHIHRYNRHASYTYATHLPLRIYVLFIAPLLAVAVAYVLVRAFGFHPVQALGPVSWDNLFGSLGDTLLRLTIAYAIALGVAVPLAVLIDYNTLTERLLLPLFDIIQSIPVLAFFPVLILLFIRYNALNLAAIFIIALSMLWNIVFSVVGGLRVMPSDIKSAARVFHIRGWDYFAKVLVPAIFPYIVTGSLLAWAQGWNIIIVAEVLHTYVPGGGNNLDLNGVGSTLVHASSLGQNDVFLAAILVMVVAIALMNFFIWQKLLHYAERFRFE